MRIGLGNDARAVYDEADSSARRDFGAISSIRDSAMALQQKKQRDMLVINHRISIPLDEFQWDYSRSGGPGGQNVNKVNSKVQLRWSPEKSPSLPPAVRDRLLALIGSKLTTEGEVIVTSQESRDQARNLQICLDKIRALVLSVATPPKTRRPTKPTLGSKIKRAVDKGKRSETKKLRKKPENES